MLSSSLLAQPVPTVSVELPPEPAMIGESYTFVIRFENTGNTAGFGPYLLLCLPWPGAGGPPTCDGATLVSAEILFSDQSLPAVIPLVQPLVSAACDPSADAVTQGPLCDEALPSFPDGCQLVAIELPFGSFYPDQPPVAIAVTVEISPLANPDVPLDVHVLGGFELGDTATGGVCIQGQPAVVPITPRLFFVRKEYLGPESETATGPSFPRSYELQVDVADGQTIDPLIIEDDLPPNLVFLGVDCPLATTVSAPLPGTKGGLVRLDVGAVTGTTADVDLACTLHFYVPELDDSGTPIIGVDTCEALSIDDVRGEGDWQPLDPRDQPGDTVISDASPEDHQLRDLCLAIQKTDDLVLDGGFPGLTPADTLEYTLAFQVSDYVQLGDLELQDVLPDGLDVLGDVDFTVVDRHGPCSGQIRPPALSFDAGERTSCGDGSLEIGLDLSAAMVAAACPQPAGRLTGALATGPPQQAAATGAITFRARLRDDYYCPGSEDDGLVDKHDLLVNRVHIEGRVYDPQSGTPTGLDAEDESVVQRPVPGAVIDKSVIAIDGVIVGPGPYELDPGDTVTFRIRYVLPSGDAEALRIEDFLPSPVFAIGQLTAVPRCIFFPPGSFPPAAGRACRWDSPTLPAPSPCPDRPDFADPASNSLCFNYGDVDDPANKPAVIDLFFTVEVSDEPFADGLQLTNEAVETEENSNGLVVQQTAIEQVVVREPELEISKGVVRACCPEPLEPIRSEFETIYGRFLPGDIFIDPGDFELAEACPTVGGLGPRPGKQIPVFDAPGSSSCARWDGVISSTALAAGDLDQDLDGAQPGDRVTFVLVVENVGSSSKGAHDVVISDTLPLDEGFKIIDPGGEPRPCITDGAGRPLAATVGYSDQRLDIALEDFPNGDGVLRPYDPDSGENIVIVTYDLEITETLEPGSCVSNRADVCGYAGVEGGPNHLECDGGSCESCQSRVDNQAISDTAEVCRRPEIEKSIVGTSASWTRSEDGIEELTIGEIVRFRLEATLPEGTLRQLELVDRLPPGFALAPTPGAGDGAVRVSVLSDRTPGLAPDLQGAANGDDPPSFAYPRSVREENGELVFDLGDVINEDRDCDAEKVVLEFNVIALNSPDNNRGDVKQNRGAVRFDGEQDEVRVDSEPVPLRILEPQLDIRKGAQTLGGDRVEFTITVSNDQRLTGDGTVAFDVRVLDELPPCLEGLPSTLGVEVAGQSFVVTGGPGLVDDRLEVLILALVPGATATITFEAELSFEGAECAELECSEVRNAASVTGQSLSSYIESSLEGSRPTAAGSESGARDGSGAPAVNDHRATTSTGVDAPCPACISGVKFHDLDGDGLRDAGEPLLEGWKIRAVRWGWFVPPTSSTFDTITDENGRYEICDLEPGTYSVYEPMLPAGWQKTFPPYFHFITLEPGEKRQGLDFGNQQLETGCIRGIKFEGDAQEEHIVCENVAPDFDFVVQQDGLVIGAGRSDESGEFEICGLAAGTYDLVEILPADWEPVNPGGDRQTVELPPGGDVTALPFCNVQKGCLEGRKFEDIDGDGERDENEPYLGGWWIEAVGIDGVPHKALTGSDGRWEICDLRPGVYQVTELVQPGWQITRPPSGDYFIVLQGGERQGGHDFGNRRVESCTLTAIVEPDEDCARMGGDVSTVTLVGENCGRGPYTCEGPGVPADPGSALCVFNGVSSGSHTFIVTDAEGQSTSLDVVVERQVQVQGIDQRNPTFPGCQNGDINLDVLSAAGGLSVRWQRNGVEVLALRNQLSGSGLKEGLYNVLITDRNGCRAQVEVNLDCVQTPLPDDRDSPLWRLQFLGSSSGDERRRFEAEGGLLDVSSDDGTGVSLGVELALGASLRDRLAVELGAMLLPALEVTRSDAEQSSVDLRLAYAALHWRPVVTSRFGFYVGPFVGYGSIEDSLIETQDDLAAGAVTGLDWTLGESGRFTLSTSLRYLVFDIDVQDPRSGQDRELRLDPWIFGLGFGYRF